MRTRWQVIHHPLHPWVNRKSSLRMSDLSPMARTGLHSSVQHDSVEIDCILLGIELEHCLPSSVALPCLACTTYMCCVVFPRVQLLRINGFACFRVRGATCCATATSRRHQPDVFSRPYSGWKHEWPRGNRSRRCCNAIKEAWIPGNLHTFCSNLSWDLS